MNKSENFFGQSNKNYFIMPLTPEKLIQTTKQNCNLRDNVLNDYCANASSAIQND